jgi:hypothetical protein
MDKRQRELRKLARRHGLVLEQSRRHFKLRDSETGALVATAGVSPSCRMSDRNLLSDLRAARR